MKLILIVINLILFSNIFLYADEKETIFEKSMNKVEDKETNETIKQLVNKDFGITAYKSNYLLPATYSFNDFEDKNRKKFETIFQISLQKELLNDVFANNSSLIFAYTQKSFWQTSADSAPFRETNYEPELFLNFYKDYEHLKLLKFSLNHLSNGKDGLESRSVNRVYAEALFQFDNFLIKPRVWYRVPPSNKKDDDNPDFSSYYGYGDLSLMYIYKKHSFEILLRNNLKFNSKNKGYTEFNWNIPLPKFLNSRNTFLFQVSHGYGQSFIDYDKEITNIGFGISFSR